MEFNLLRLIFTLRLDTEQYEPYGLYGIKRVFPEAFRKTISCSLSECSNCPQMFTCPYWEIFSQALSNDPVVLKRHQKPPLPFVFDIPEVPVPARRGTKLQLNLTIVGSAIYHVNNFVEAVRLVFLSAGRDSLPRAAIIDISMADYSGNQLRYTADTGNSDMIGQMSLLAAADIADNPLISPDMLNIDILTPIQLMHDKRPLRQLSFSSLCRGLFRRISALTATYEGSELAADYRWLAEQSRTVITVVDESYWVEWGRGRGGLIGRVEFTGAIEQFRLFLRLGEYLHVGKGAAYGMGQYTIGERQACKNQLPGVD